MLIASPLRSGRKVQLSGAPTPVEGCSPVPPPVQHLLLLAPDLLQGRLQGRVKKVISYSQI
jgi:hypothetical protein